MSTSSDKKHSAGIMLFSTLVGLELCSLAIGGVSGLIILNVILFILAAANRQRFQRVTTSMREAVSSVFSGQR